MRSLAVLAALLGACGGAPARPPAPRGVLVVHGLPQAELWIDEALIGQLAQLPGGVRLAAGAHHVELRLDGYHTRYADVSVAAGRADTLELPLTEEQP